MCHCLQVSSVSVSAEEGLRLKLSGLSSATQSASVTAVFSRFVPTEAGDQDAAWILCPRKRAGCAAPWLAASAGDLANVLRVSLEKHTVWILNAAIMAPL